MPLLREVTSTAYFRYFKVNLFCDCPLWPDDSMCALEACSVCECDDNEVPPAWRQEATEGCQTLRVLPISVSIYGLPVHCSGNKRRTWRGI